MSHVLFAKQAICVDKSTLFFQTFTFKRNTWANQVKVCLKLFQVAMCLQSTDYQLCIVAERKKNVFLKKNL
jgi:hypothetical protein